MEGTNEQRPASRLPMLTAGAIAVLILLCMCLYPLRVTEMAVVTTLGKPSVVRRPGLHARLPWPAQRVTKLDKRGRLLVTAARGTTTRDNISVIVKTFAVWRISEEHALAFFNGVGTVFEAEAQLRSLIESKRETVIRSHLRPTTE